MKYKFKPQTGILVAGMLAASYASACFWQQTDAICFASGTSVDTIYWNGGALGRPRFTPARTGGSTRMDPQGTFIGRVRPLAPAT